MSTKPAPRDVDQAWSELLISRDALTEITESADSSMKQALISV